MQFTKIYTMIKSKGKQPSYFFNQVNLGGGGDIQMEGEYMDSIFMS